MFNGYRHDDPNGYAPETAVGTGALEPLVDEYEAAEKVPTVDEHTLDDVDRRSQNVVHEGKTIAYSGEPTAEPTTGDDERSTGEELEVRNAEDDTAAGSQVAAKEVDDAEVNQPAADVRPEAPQATKRTRKADKTV